MKLALLGTLFLSDKRKDLLLLLVEKPMSIDEIKDSLNVNSSAMMVQIKILMDQGIVLYEDDYYKLTSFGKVIAKKMMPLLNTLMVFEENQQYWDNHKVKSIPAPFLERIDELGSCEFVEPELNNMFELPKKFTDNLVQSKCIMEISSSFNPTYPYKYIELARNGVHISLIITKFVFERFETEFYEQLKIYLQMKNTQLFVYEKNINFASIVVTNIFLSLTLFYKTGIFHNHSLMSFEKSALTWGKDLHQFFKNNASEIIDI